MIRYTLLLSLFLSGCNLLNDFPTAKPQQEMIYVMVAYEELPAGVPIVEEKLYVVEIPREYTPKAFPFLSYPEYVVGRMPTQRILQNEFIRQEDLLDLEAKQPQAVVGGQDRFRAQWAGSGKASITPFARGHEAFVGRLWLDAGAAVPEHQDETEEFLYILSGGGTLLIDGQAHEISAGHVVYMPAKATVSFSNGDQPLEALQVFAGPQSADKYDAWGEKPQ